MPSNNGTALKDKVPSSLLMPKREEQRVLEVMVGRHWNSRWPTNWFVKEIYSPTHFRLMVELLDSPLQKGDKEDNTTVAFKGAVVVGIAINGPM